MWATSKKDRIVTFFSLKQPLDDAQLDNWHKYLSFEEKQDPRKAAYLYERAMVACANYPEFWIRYAHWAEGFSPSLSLFFYEK